MGEAMGVALFVMVGIVIVAVIAAESFQAYLKAINAPNDMKTIHTSDTVESITAAMQNQEDKQLLVVVAPNHWLMHVLCREKRLMHAAALAAYRNEANGSESSTEEIKNELLAPLLSKLQHEQVAPEDFVQVVTMSTILASAFSELLPEEEPLLVELALTHCLHEWGRGHRGGASVDDASAFEAFFRAELQSEQASKWFDCQLVICTLQVLTLSRRFYKERITNQALHELIAISIVDSRGDSEDPFVERIVRQGRKNGAPASQEFQISMMVRLAMKENKAAASAWRAWLGDELATDSYPPATRQVLGDRMINPTFFQPNKRVYFPLPMTLKRLSSNTFWDLSGVVNYEEMANNEMVLPCFLYTVGELLGTKTETTTSTVAEKEAEHKVVGDTEGHPHAE